ncbi:MAG TPA: hypothetical protein VNG51_25460 [Ktedonobacteraceae bacterium]|nr:hypothetical protein [Ktedonobacteraceae bacterium]
MGEDGLYNEISELADKLARGERITGASGASGTGTTDANGVISSENPQLAALIDADPLGVWQVEVIGGAAISDGGTLKFDRVYNIQLGLEYTFEYVQEEVI